MIYYTNIRCPKKSNYNMKGQCFTQEVIDQIVKDINKTKGYHVVEITNSETEDIIKIQINTDVIDDVLFD